jgi:rRNA-processing protein FCF1
VSATNLERRAVLSRQGLLLDSNLLVVVFVGLWRRSFIGRRVTGDEYDDLDFEYLSMLIGRSNPWIVTPHILTEVDNRLDRIGDPGRVECRRVLESILATMKESSSRAIQIVDDLAFSRIGLADAAILRVARNRRCLVLTSDAGLYAELVAIGAVAEYYPDVRRMLLTEG